MSKYRVTPTRGTVKAPSMIVEVPISKTQESDAIKLARSKSRLSHFDSWVFIAEMISYKN